ncbi:MAG: hypothetical protein ACM3ML_00625, partial [Micromonosporaceae bacterium]
MPEVRGAAHAVGYALFTAKGRLELTGNGSGAGTITARVNDHRLFLTRGTRQPLCIKFAAAWRRGSTFRCVRISTGHPFAASYPQNAF